MSEPSKECSSFLGAVHSRQSYFVIVVAISLSALDIIAAIRRFVVFLRSSDRSFRNFWEIVVKKQERFGSGPEYTGLVVDEPEEFEPSKADRDSFELQEIRLGGDTPQSQTQQWANAVHHHSRHHSLTSERTVFGGQSSNHSDDTLNNPKALHRLEPRRLVHLIGRTAFAVTERVLVFAGFGQLLIGIVTYTGQCQSVSRLTTGA